MSRSAHPAGPSHGHMLPGAPAVGVPADVNGLDARIWPRTAARVDGELNLAGVPVTALAAAHGTPAFLLDTADLRDRARTYADAFAGADVFYAGKAFLCTAVAGLIAEEGLGLDVCSAGELQIALRARVDPDAIALHGNNKSDRGAAAGAGVRGRAGGARQ